MMRLQVILSAIIALAIIIAPAAASRADACVCDEPTPSCHCHAPECRLLATRGSGCACAALVAPLTNFADWQAPTDAGYLWTVIAQERLVGINPVPPLRPPKSV